MTLLEFAAPRRYVTPFNAMNQQPGGQRRMAPRKEIACGYSKCPLRFVPTGSRNVFCCDKCRVEAKTAAQKEEYGRARAAKPADVLNGVTVCASDARALEVWNRERKGATSLAKQEADYYTFGMTLQQKRNWQAKQAAKLEILKRGMGL